MNVSLSEEFVVRVLETPDVPRENLIVFFKWTTGDKNRELFSVTTRSLEAVVTTEMLNTLISLFLRLGKRMAGYAVFDKFGYFSCVTNPDTYYFTIEALCRRSVIDRVGLVCEKMLSEGKLPEAERLMKKMTNRGLYMNGITKSLIRAVKELEEEAKGTKELRVEA